MTSFSKSVRTNVGTCITCQSEVETNGKRALTCEDCRDPPEELTTHSGPCESVTVERGDVTLTKSITIHEETPCIEYSLVSTQAEQVRFRVQDRLPGHNGGTNASTNGDGQGATGIVDVTWWIPGDGGLQFRRPVPARALAKFPTMDRTIDVVPQLSVGESGFGDDPGGPGYHEGAKTNDVESDSMLTPNSTGILVAVPAYNEDRSIGDVVSAANRHADAVLVVDDGSDDETVARAWEAGAFVRRHEFNRGYGATLQTIFSTAKAVDADHLVVLDGDGQHDPDDVPKLVEKQRASDAEILIGSRFTVDDTADIPLYRRFGLAVINGLTNLSLGSVRPERRIGDTQSGFRAYDRRAIDSLAADDTIGDRMGVSYDILYHAHRRDYDVEEVGTVVSYDETSTSSHGALSHGMMVVSTLVPVLERDRPLVSLGVPGLALLVTGLGAGVTMLEGFVTSGNFDSVGVFGALTTALLGVFVCMTGIFLHVLHRFHDTVESAR